MFCVATITSVYEIAGRKKVNWNDEMAKVQITNVTVLDNPTAFLNPFQFEITFECLENLEKGRFTSVYLAS